MRSDIRPGGVFPDYALPDHTSTVRALSEIQGDDPLILTLARGHYCPKEHQQHLELAAFQPKLAVAYTQIATIATDEHHTLQEFRASVGAQWPNCDGPRQCRGTHGKSASRRRCGSPARAMRSCCREVCAHGKARTKSVAANGIALFLETSCENVRAKQ